MGVMDTTGVEDRRGSDGVDSFADRTLLRIQMDVWRLFTVILALGYNISPISFFGFFIFDLLVPY